MSNYWARKSVSRRQALRAAALAGGGIAALSLIGCGSDDDGGGDAPSSDPRTGGAKVDPNQAKPGGTIRIGSLDPGGTNTIDRANNWHIAGFPFEGLTAFSWGVRGVGFNDPIVEPNLASALPEQSPDGLTYTFKLKPGTKFHNGTPVTSEDVKYSYDRWATHLASPARTHWLPWYDRTDTPDPNTVVLRSKIPFGEVLAMTTAAQYNYIQSKAYEETPEAPNRPMGTGPFVFESYVPAVSAFYRKNAEYHLKPYPYFDRVECFFTTDIARRVTDFVAKQVDQPYLVYANDRDAIKQQRPDAEYVAATPYPGGSIFMRLDQAPFNDARVRKALSMAIDRTKVDQGVNKGEGEDDQFFALLNKNVTGTSAVKDLGDAAKFWAYNPTEAKALLSAAGITSPIVTTMSSWDQNVLGQFLVDIATLTIAQWQQLGVANVTHRPLPLPQYNSTVGRGEYEGMGLGVNSGLAGTYNFVLNVRNVMYTGPDGVRSAGNISYINNPTISALADKQVSQLKLEDRQGTYREIEKIIANEQYRITMKSLSQNWFFDPSLKNAWPPSDQGSRTYVKKWWKA